MPESIVEIGDYAFRYYYVQKEIEIPKNVKRIGRYAFYYNEKLSKIKMNSLVPPNIDSQAYIPSRAKIYVPAESFHAYRTTSPLDDRLLIGGDGISVTIDNSAAGNLSRQVLLKADYLQEVNKLTVKAGEMNSEDWETIKTMSNLVQLDIQGMSVSTIPNNAFKERWAIEKVVLPANLTSIGSYAFNNSGIKEITIPNTVTTIDNYAFYYCDSLKTAVVSKSVQNIPYRCFNYCRKLEKVTLPDNLTTIDSYAFANCDSLKECKLPSQLTSLGNHAFYLCGLESVSLPSQLTEIPEYAFYNNNIKEVDIPASVQRISTYAFGNNQELKTITLHEGLKSIASNAFYNVAVTELELPSTLTSISKSICYSENLETLKVNSMFPISISQAPTNTDGVTLYVPDFSVNTYKAESGWNDYASILPLDVRPTNIYSNDKFEMTLSDEAANGYTPNITLDWSSDYENGDYKHGQLIVGNVLNVNSLDFRISPYAKRITDEDEYYNFYYGYNNNSTTEYNPTPIMVYGTLNAEDVTIRLSNRTSTWQFISLPVDIAMKDIKADNPDTQWVIRSYSGANRASGSGSEWINLTEDDVLKAGKGYIMNCYLYGEDMATFTLKAGKTTFDSENKVINLEEHVSKYANDRSWNLVGNPYPTYCRIDHLNFTSPVTIWNSYNDNYYAYSPQDDDYILSPGEAFFVQRTTLPSITISASGRQIDRKKSESNYSKAKAATKSNREVFNLGIVDSYQKADRTRLVVNPAASSGYDASVDAAKFVSTDASQPMLCTLENGVRYAINERPLSNGVIPVSVYATTQEGMQLKLLSAKNTTMRVYLEDKLSSTMEEVDESGVMLTKLSAGQWNDNRFFIHLSQDTATGIDVVEQTNESSSIYDLSGRKVSSTNKNGIYITNGKKSIK